MSHFAAVFDACVLHPADLRDFLMWLARTRLFRAKWTATIHQEWIRSIVRRRPEAEQDELQTKLFRTASLLNSAIPDSLVTGDESLIGGISLPDPDDRHVVAAAVFSRAEVIVTFNLKDFPATSLQPLNVQAQHPDDFVLSLIDSSHSTRSDRHVGLANSRPRIMGTFKHRSICGNINRLHHGW